MTSTLALVALVSQFLAADPTPAEDAMAKSAAAAERAAVAAEKAADAAQKTAEIAKALADKATAAAVAPKPEETKAEVKKPEGPTWTGAIGFGLISLTGNSRSIAMNATAGVERTSDNWILGIKAAGGYGEAQAADGGDFQVVALNASAQARAALRFTPRYSAFLLGGIDTDHVASIEERPYGEAGIGILWLDEMEGDFSKLKLNTDIGFRVGYEIRQQYYPTPAKQDSVTIGAPRLGLAFRYALNKTVIFTEDAEVLSNVVGDVRWLVNSNSKIAARIVSQVSVTLAFGIKYDSAPAAGKVSTDTALALGMEAGF